MAKRVRRAEQDPVGASVSDPVITPRITRLVRVPDPRTLQASVVALASDDIARSRVAVLVPTAGAARELRRALATAVAHGSLPLELLTRAGLYERLHQLSAGSPPLLPPHAREVLLRRAARAAADRVTPPFSLRPGIVLEMLRFYDELRRREQSLGDFTRKVLAELESAADTDRGAERLLRQTEFLTDAYREFETVLNATGGIDEHGLRLLLMTGAASPFEHVIVTVADQAADPHGLYACDFDLLARVSGLRRLDVVATENVLASGFHERVHALLPGIEEVKRTAADPSIPTLCAPASDADDVRWFTSRDREEELVDFARDLKQREVSSLDRCALVYQRPLPYLYLARQVFGAAGTPYRSADGLPLAAEPFAAALDVVLSFVTNEANRASTIELVSSPHFTFRADPNSVTALDRWLRDLKYAGGWERLDSVAVPGAALDAHAMARNVAAELSLVRNADSAAAQIDALLAFLQKFESQPPPEARYTDRHLRARAIIFEIIQSLRDAYARHDARPLTVEELAGTIRRWIDAETYTQDDRDTGVRLLDAASAPYADVDELRILGLVETDWPERGAGSIFYPSAILSQLGWPPEPSRVAAARARFRDLLMLPRVRLSASAFMLEDDALVSPSPFVEELEGLEIERWAVEASQPGAASDDTPDADWLELRASRAARSGAPQPPIPVASRTYAVSHVERYLDCPFKYYAAHVLRLEEETVDKPGLTPQERGHFVHEVFEEFFRQWQRSGQQTITIENVAPALDLFERVVDSKLDSLPEADRALERTHLLGSAAASGLAERAFAFEIEQGGRVVERLLEHPIEGTFVFESESGPRGVPIRVKADRIDLMDDGTLRVVDYKLNRAPKPGRALQLSIYGVSAQQALDGYRGRSWTLGRAGYVAFNEKDPFVPLGRSSSLESALKEGQQRFLDAIDAIERGEFPVRPDEPFRCQWCGYSGVCRKDYVGDE